MAAILCTAPCKLCSPLCECIGKGCGQACKCCGEMCCSCQACLSSPFCLFVTAATVLNIPPVVVGVKSLVSAVSGDGLQQIAAGDGCHLVMWTVVNAVTSALNIGAAWYLASKVAQINNGGGGNGGAGPVSSTSDARLRNKRSAASRTAHVLCYDPVIACYIVIAIFYFGWLSLGGMWVAREAASAYDPYNDSEDGGSSCDSDVRTYAEISLGTGWTYVLVGSMTFFCSLCCTACDRRQYGNQNMPLWMPNSPQQRKQEQQQQLHQVNTGMMQSTSPPNYQSSSNNSQNLPVAFAVPAEEVVEILPTTGTGVGKGGGKSSAVLQEQRVQNAPPPTAPVMRRDEENPYAAASAPPSESEHTTRATVERTVEQAKNLFGSAFAAASAAAAGKKK